MTAPLTAAQGLLVAVLEALLPRLKAGDIEAWSWQVRPHDPAAFETALKELFLDTDALADDTGARLSGYDMRLLSELAEKLGTDLKNAYAALARLAPRWFAEFPDQLRDAYLALPEVHQGDAYELLGADDGGLWDTVCLPFHARYRKALGQADVWPEDIVRVLLRDPVACGQVQLEARRAGVSR